MKTKLLIVLLAILVVILACIKEYTKYIQTPLQHCTEETTREFDNLSGDDKKALDLLIKVKALKDRSVLIDEYCKQVIDKGRF